MNQHILHCLVCGNPVITGTNVTKIRCLQCRIRLCRVCGKHHMLNDNEVCKHIQLFPTLVKYFGFDKSLLGSEKAIQEYHRVRNSIYELYWNEKKSILELMDIYHYTSGNARNFSKILTSLGIPIRNLSQAIKNGISLGKYINHKNHYLYKCGFHITWNGKKVWYRSSYELDYARLLDDQKIEYDMESIRIPYKRSFDNTIHIAIPDFYIPLSNELIEVKSSFTYDENDMIDKITEYIKLGYKVKLIYEHEEAVINTNPITIQLPENCYPPYKRI